MLRFGYSLTGAKNSPASAEATGLEVDKLDHTYVKKYLDHYLEMYEVTVGYDLMGHKGLRYAAISSVRSRPVPHPHACSTRGNARGHPHSTPRGVREYSDPSLGGFRSSRRADRAKDR